MYYHPKHASSSEYPNQLYEIRHFLERPFYCLSHKRQDSLEPYLSSDGKLRIDVKATISGLGVATVEDAEIGMFIYSELFPLLMNDPSCREVTFKRCDLLRRLHRNAGGNQYKALKEGLIRLATTQITTNMGPDGHPAEPTTFSILNSQTWSSSRRQITVQVSDWVAQTLTKKTVLGVPEYYFSMPRGYVRGLWRIARKHVGSQRQHSFEPLVGTLRNKMGAGSGKESFNNKLKEIVERDPLEEYKLTWVPDPVRKRHKVRMTLRTIPKLTSLGFDDVDLSEFYILPDTE